MIGPLRGSGVKLPKPLSKKNTSSKERMDEKKYQPLREGGGVPTIVVRPLKSPLISFVCLPLYPPDISPGQSRPSCGLREQCKSAFEGCTQYKTFHLQKNLLEARNRTVILIVLCKDFLMRFLSPVLLFFWFGSVKDVNIFLYSCLVRFKNDINLCLDPP